MTRRTRSQLERLDYEITITKQQAVSVVQAVLWLTGAAALLGALAASAAVPDWGVRLQIAGRVGLVGLFVFATYGLLLAALHEWRLSRPEPEPGDEWPFHETAPNTRTRYPEGWTRAAYTQYMTAVLDEDDETGFNQRDAAAFGHDRDRFNALVAWVHARGWYRYANGTDNRNGGEWIASPATILATTPDDGNG